MSINSALISEKARAAHADLARQRRKRRYGCPPDVEGSCGGIGIQAVELEEMIEELILQVLGDPTVQAFVDKHRTKDKGNADVLAELDVIEARRTGLAEAFAMGELIGHSSPLPRRRWITRRDELQAQLTTDTMRGPGR